MRLRIKNSNKNAIKFQNKFLLTNKPWWMSHVLLVTLSVQIDLYTMESQQRSEKKEETEARLSELEHLKEEAQVALDKVNQGQVELNCRVG